MNEWKDKSNNQILTEIKQMEAEHESIKTSILAKYEAYQEEWKKLVAVEERFAAANKVIKDRLNGNHG